MVVPLSKLIFHVDNGFSSHLEGTGLAAEYHIKSGDVVWRKLGRSQMTSQKHLSYKINNYLWISSPLLIVPLLAFLGNYTKILATPLERLGNMGLIAPILLGILFFLSFEALMVMLRETYPLTTPPIASVQKTYFESIYNISIKRNEAWSRVKTPYLTNVIVFTFVCGFVTPLMFWIYLMPGTFGEFLMKLGVLSLLISLLPNFLWNIVFKNRVYKKIINRLKIELENENHGKK